MMVIPFNDKEKMSRHYREHLLGNVMPFWEKHTLDAEAGGFFTCLDREGKVFNENKWIWGQGRQTYMFSALYNAVEKRDEWLDLARCGRDFLVKHAHAGGGRWHYQLDRYGTPVVSERSIATDAFALMGLCEFAVAAGTDEDRELIELTYQTLEKNVRDPDNVEFHHFSLDPNYDHHPKYMLSVNLCGVVSQVLGEERTRSLCDMSLDKILNVFAHDEEQSLFEMVNRDGSVVNTPQGRNVNPGHVLESMWFCIEEGLRRKDPGVVDRAVRIADWHVRKGWDHEYGGILAFVDPAGNPGWVPEVVKKSGEGWDSKIWWVQAEALYTLALCAEYADYSTYYPLFSSVHEYTCKHFYDYEYGEWFMYLRRDGTPNVTDKGNRYRSAFHVPRACMRLMQLFQG